MIPGGHALTVHGGTKLDTFPLVAKVKEMLEDVDAAGIEFGDFTLRGELKADASTRVVYEQPKLRLEKPLTIALDGREGRGVIAKPKA